MAKDVARPLVMNLLHITWTFEYLEHDDWNATDARKSGVTYCNKNNMKVRLSDEDGAYSEANIREIVLHEMQHAIWFSMQLGQHKFPDDTEDLEELVTSSLTAPLLAVLRDNPEIVKYLTA